MVDYEQHMKIEKWKLDKHIPIALLVGILLQTFGLVWWFATWKAEYGTRITMLERWVKQNDQLLERVKGVEVRVDGILQQNSRIERKIDQYFDKH